MVGRFKMAHAYLSLILMGATMIVHTWGNHHNATSRGCADIDPKCALIQDVVDNNQVSGLLYLYILAEI